MPKAKLDNLSLFFESAGNGEPIVFLAGTSLGTFVWEKVIGAIGHKYQKIGIDVRGSGKSDAPKGPYTVELMASEVRQLLGHLEIDKPLLVGHSMGGFIAQELAISCSLALRGLVLVSTSSTGHPNHLGSTKEAIAALNRTKGSFEEIFAGMVDIGVGMKVKKDNPQALEDFRASQLRNPPRGHGFLGQRYAANRFDARPHLGKIDCPCHVVHGSDDQVISIKNGKELAAGIKGAEFIELKGVGHFPQVEAPGKLAQIAVNLICALA